MIVAPENAGLEVLLSTLKNSHDLRTTLGILQILDALLSAGTVKRISYLITKGGSEALLHTLVNVTRILPLDYEVILPLMHLIVKVGQRDKRFGQKAQEIGALNEILNLMKCSLPQAKYVTPCLWTVKICASSVTVGAALGKSGITRFVLNLLSPYTTRNTRAVRAATEALSALLKSKWNSRRAVDSGYIHRLLKLYEDWHQRDMKTKYVLIQAALLKCIKNITNLQKGKKAFLEADGMRVLLSTSQVCGSSPDLHPVIKLATQIMRKCYPKQRLPLLTLRSCYSFVLPNAAHSQVLEGPSEAPQEDVAAEENEEQDDEDGTETEEPGCSEEEDDLETDLSRLKPNPELDRPVEELKQYERLCPELVGYFQDSDSDDQSLSQDNASCSTFFTPSRPLHQDSRETGRGGVGEGSPKQHNLLKNRRTRQASPSSSGIEGENGSKGSPKNHCTHPAKSSRINHSKDKMNQMHLNIQRGDADLSRINTNVQEYAGPFNPSWAIGGEHECQNTGNKLLKMCKEIIPFHDPHVYTIKAEETKSASDYKTLAFPDYWGHMPPRYQEPLTGQWCGGLRAKIFEDIQRLINSGDILNRVIYDTESPSLVTSGDDTSLKFFSNFESGNLRKAVQIRKYEYDLIMNADINTNYQHQWFYFEISGMRAGIPYRFNIINCEKTNSQFNYGMQPVMYSVHEALCRRAHWVRVGSDIYYYKNHYRAYGAEEKGQKETAFYTLTFTITFLHSKDVCYLAYHYPYTYSTLMTHLYLLEQSLNPDQVYFRHQVLCSTLGGNNCPVITITASPGSQREQLQQFWNRQYIVLTGRVHPGESNASWVMKGTLEFLVSNNPIACCLRDTYIFKIIPMLNPDGVINGCHRCSLSGEDLNRQWSEPSPDLHPTIYHTKGLLSYMKSIGRTPLVFCDYHGHSRKKNVFMYGCSLKETLWQSKSSIDTATLKEDIGYRPIPRILDKICPAFSINRCCFLVQKSLGSTARVVVWREIGVLRSYTMESTYCGCDQGKYNGLQIRTRELEEIGAKFCTALLKLKKDALSCSAQLTFQDAALLDLDNELHNDKNMSHSDVSVDDEPPCPEEIDYYTDNCTEDDDDPIDLTTEVDESSDDELYC
ncbi:LOW QUALITY PROTEIN: cytosolic carboxypeptidase 4 [Pristis pectinata]|uniref:LOW QUALITY PROTEIN: cytosolic carboxypeptidase 4 n=1 Tax=Pristis pectinata TaxID=685728 RepID=UPI00223C93DB|nr:LOW QUALITY PROTEIN: cytosolic carboxypeptidase 4 [Pristis pectinata]